MLTDNRILTNVAVFTSLDKSRGTGNELSLFYVYLEGILSSPECGTFASFVFILKMSLYTSLENNLKKLILYPNLSIYKEY